MLKTICLLILTFTFCAFGQVKKGRVFVGGQFQIQNTFNKSESKIYVNLIPSIGCMLSNKVGIQLDLSYSNAGEQYFKKYYFFDYSSNSYRTFSVNLSVPIFLPLSDKFYFYFAPSIGLLNSNKLYESNFGDYNTIFASRITPGLVYFPHQKVSVNLALGGIMSFEYSFRYTFGLVEILNFSTSMPTVGISLWFGKVE